MCCSGPRHQKLPIHFPAAVTIVTCIRKQKITLKNECLQRCKGVTSSLNQQLTPQLT
jgi:hypothetical protein